jgi:hypothetical protein
MAPQCLPLLLGIEHGAAGAPWDPVQQTSEPEPAPPPAEAASPTFTPLTPAPPMFSSEQGVCVPRAIEAPAISGRSALPRAHPCRSRPVSSRHRLSPFNPAFVDASRGRGCGRDPPGPTCGHLSSRGPDRLRTPARRRPGFREFPPARSRHNVTEVPAHEGKDSEAVRFDQRLLSPRDRAADG